MIRMRESVSVFLVVWTLAPTATFAVDKTPLAHRSEAVERAAAGAESGPGPGTVRFFNRDIVTLRTAYFGYQPAQRAAAARQRIRETVAKNGPGAVHITQGTDGLTVTIDGHFNNVVLGTITKN